MAACSLLVHLMLLATGMAGAAAMPALLLQPHTWRLKARYPHDWDVSLYPALRDSITGEELQGSTTTHLRVKAGVKPELSRRTWAAIEYTSSVAPVEMSRGDVCTQADWQQGIRRLRLSARVDVAGLAPGIGWAGLYLGVLDARGYEMGLDNMHNRPILSTTFPRPARLYEVVVDVPPGAARLEYGLHLVGGTGSATLSHLALQWVAQDVPLTTPFLSLPPLDKFFPPDFGSPGFGIP